MQTHNLTCRYALEVGAGEHSSLAPLLLDMAQEVECSAFNASVLPVIRASHMQLVPESIERIHYTQQNVLDLQGCWDLIVLKSVLGGVHRKSNSTLADVHATIAHIIQRNLQPGGVLVTLDNGRTAMAPLLMNVGARRNDWRFFLREDFPPADVCYSFGLLSTFSAQTRLGWLGGRIDDALYGIDCLLMSFMGADKGQRSVYLHAYYRQT
jgi:hypothetical protein